MTKVKSTRLQKLLQKKLILLTAREKGLKPADLYKFYNYKIFKKSKKYSCFQLIRSQIRFSIQRSDFHLIHEGIEFGLDLDHLGLGFHLLDLKGEQQTTKSKSH